MLFLYIDPGSGTIIFQLLIAGIAGVVSYSRRIRLFLKDSIWRIFGKK